MTPWWALVVGLISGIVFLCVCIILLALCIQCVKKNRNPDKQKLQDPETPSNNNDKAYINHAIVHDEYSTPLKRQSQNGDANRIEEVDENEENEEESPEVPAKMDDLSEESGTTKNKKQNGVRWKDDPEIIGDHPESDAETRVHEDTIKEEEEEEHTEKEEEEQAAKEEEEQAEKEEEEKAEEESEQTENQNDESEQNVEDENHEESQNTEEGENEANEEAENQDNGDSDDDDERDRKLAVAAALAATAGAGGVLAGIAIANHMEPNKVSLIRQVREGTYGAVYRGEYEKDGKDVPALIKTFPDNAPCTDEQKRDFVKEATKMQSLEHKHLLSAIGVTEKREMPLVVYPEANLLDLKSYIVDPHHTLSVRHMLDFSLHMAEAMAFLHKHDIVHEDLAARNCWLNEARIIRVCDGALSEELFPEDYETTAEIKQPMPIRWMSPECLKEAGNFTKASDVWAYGILIWELFKRGQERPYWPLPTQKVYNNVLEGDVLIKPFFAPDNVYQLIQSCWNPEPDERPTFDKIVSTFKNEIYKRTSGRRSMMLPLT